MIGLENLRLMGRLVVVASFMVYLEILNISLVYDVKVPLEKTCLNILCIAFWGASLTRQVATAHSEKLWLTNLRINFSNQNKLKEPQIKQLDCLE